MCGCVLHYLRQYIQASLPQKPPDPEKIPDRFSPYIINHPQFQGPPQLRRLGRQLESSVENQSWVCVPRPSHSPKHKPHIWTFNNFPNYIIKTAREGRYQDRVPPDATIRRLWQATRLRKIILKHNLQSRFRVPNKYLYYDKQDQKWYLIADKVHDLVAQTMDSLEDLQALVTFMFEANLEDLHNKNIMYSPTDQVWYIIDTEPVSRYHKIQQQILLGPYFYDAASARIRTAVYTIHAFIDPDMLARSHSLLTEKSYFLHAGDLLKQVETYLNEYLINSAQKVALLMAIQCILPMIIGGIVGWAASIALTVKTSLLVGQIVWSADLSNSLLTRFTHNRPFPRLDDFTWRLNNHPKISISLIVAAFIGTKLYIPYAPVSIALSQILIVITTIASMALALKPKQTAQSSQ